MSSSVSHHGQPSCHHQHRPSSGGQHQDGQTHGNHSPQPILHPYLSSTACEGLFQEDGDQRGHKSDQPVGPDAGCAHLVLDNI